MRPHQRIVFAVTPGAVRVSVWAYASLAGAPVLVARPPVITPGAARPARAHSPAAPQSPPDVRHTALPGTAAAFASAPRPSRPQPSQIPDRRACTSPAARAGPLPQPALQVSAVLVGALGFLADFLLGLADLAMLVCGVGAASVIHAESSHFLCPDNVM